MRIHYLQHVAFENPGAIGPWARRRRHRLSVTRLHRNESLPQMDAFDWLIVLGGPMNVYEEDEYPWLTDEKRFIERALRQGKGVFGICLGAQLIASVLGAPVRRNPEKEIGWFPVEQVDDGLKTALFEYLPGTFLAFHWHGDTFDLPAGAVHAFRSEGCEQQAFVYADRVVALQFHLETTRGGVEKLIRHCAADMTKGKFVQKPDEMLASRERFDDLHHLLEILLGRMEKIGERENS